jgi:hypothetical protein
VPANGSLLFDVPTSALASNLSAALPLAAPSVTYLAPGADPALLRAVFSLGGGGLQNCTAASLYNCSSAPLGGGCAAAWNCSSAAVASALVVPGSPAGLLRLAVRLSSGLPADALVQVEGLGQTLGGASALRSRYWAGPLDDFALSTEGPAGEPLDRAAFAAVRCGANDQPEAVAWEEQLATLESACLSNPVAAGVGNLSMRLALPLNLTAALTVRVYLPVDFVLSDVHLRLSPSQGLESWPATLQYGVAPGIRLLGAPGGGGGGEVPRNRTVVTAEVVGFAALSAGDSVLLELGALASPPYALGYPASAASPADATLIVQFLAPRPEEGGGGGPAPVFRSEWLSAVVPAAAQDLRVSLGALATAELGRVDISFRPALAVPVGARITVRLPAAPEADPPGWGLVWTAETLGAVSLQWALGSSPPQVAYLAAAIEEVPPVPSESADPLLCTAAGGGDPSFFTLDQPGCPAGCGRLGLSTASYAPSSRLVLSRVAASAALNGSFLVPRVAGVVCAVQEPLRAQPGDWVVPAGCNTSGAYDNVTRTYAYMPATVEIPAGAQVNLSLAGVRSPLRYGDCAGALDLHVEGSFSAGWLSVQRRVWSCLGASSSAGRLRQIAVSLSSGVAGASTRELASLEPVFRFCENLVSVEPVERRGGREESPMLARGRGGGRVGGEAV